MFNLFNKILKEKINVIDIRDGSVGGMILSVDRASLSQPEKLFSTRIKLPFQKEFSHKRHFYATAQAISNVASEIHNRGQNAPDKIVCLIGPHMHISQRRNIKIQYKQPTLITSGILNRLISNDIHIFEEKHLTSGLTNGDSVNTLFEHKVMQIKLNGYETSKPVGKKATDVSISIFASVIPKIVLADLKNIISKNFHSNNIEFHSFSFIISDVMRNLGLDSNGLVLVQIEDEITEISIIRNGIIQNIASFPLGKNLLIRVICAVLGTIPDAAESYLKMYNSKAGSPEVVKKMSEIFSKVNSTWSDLFFQTMKKTSYNHLLPQNFYVVVNQNYTNVFFDLIKKIELSNLLALNKQAEISTLGSHVFENLCKNRSDCPDDIYFLAASVFAGNLPKSEGLTFFR